MSKKQKLEFAEDDKKGYCIKGTKVTAVDLEEQFREIIVSTCV